MGVCLTVTPRDEHPSRSLRSVQSDFAAIAGLANFGLQRTTTSLRSALAAEAVIRWPDEGN